MTAPLDGAGPLRYTILPLDGTPPAKAAGDMLTYDTTTGFTVSVAVLVMPPYAAEMVTVAVTATLDVVMSNFAEVAPSGTVTLAGTTVDALELVNFTAAPPVGAAVFR